MLVTVAKRLLEVFNRSWFGLIVMSMILFKCLVVCGLILAIGGGDVFAETPPVGTKSTLVKFPESTNSIGMRFRLIPRGTFTMGERDAPNFPFANHDNTHEVTLTKPFKMGVYEVTQAQYEKVMGVNPSKFKGADNPVDTVSWEEAVEFCRKLSEIPAEKVAGNVYRLPTEAEWAYACRAGTTTKYSFGDNESDLGDYAWYFMNSEKKNHPVGGKKPNPWGLFDMHGNVWEWCMDRYCDLRKGAVTDPNGRGSRSPAHMFRGGGWDDEAHDCRSANRYGYAQSLSGSSGDRGFRVCLSQSGK